MNFETKVIDKAFDILTRQLNEATISMSSAPVIEKYLLHKLILEEREIFGAMWLDVKNRLITCEDIALGTLYQVCVYPREILKSALRHNAANVIFYHNHPTGDASPSHTDRLMTMNMKKLLKIIDVQLLDHIIVSGTKTRSVTKIEEL
jgi:DNA repair protein RadC